ncbi:predicted protein, partial [Nematostella vectensis]
YLFYVHRLYSHIPSPPRDSFFFGHVPYIRRERTRGREIHEVVIEWTNKYGPIIVFWAFHNPVVFVVSPEMVKKVLVTYDLPKSTRVYEKLQFVYNQRCTGRGILTEPDPSAWHKKRTLLNPAFHRKNLMNLMSPFNVICERMIDKLSLISDGKTQVDLADELSRTTLDVIGKVAFDIDLDAIKDDNTPFPSANSSTLMGIQQQFRSPFWRINPFMYPYQQKVIKDIKFLREFGEKVILKRKAAIEKGMDMPKDVLNHILYMCKEDVNVPMEELVDDFVTFFIAGQETTSNLLAFTVFEIGNNPDIEQRIQNEISKVLGSRQFVEYQDLGKLQYLGQTLKESLRLHPPIPGFSRFTPDAIELGGYAIPANTGIAVDVFATHRYPGVWTEPDKFNPHRFGPGSDDTITSSMFLPFANGPRTCIGKMFAEFEAKVIMARLYQEFKIKLVPGQKLLYDLHLTMRPKGGVLCTLDKR